MRKEAASQQQAQANCAHWRLLAEASGALAHLVDGDKALQQVAAWVVRDLADHCFIDTWVDLGDVQRVASVHRMPDGSVSSLACHSVGLSSHAAPSPPMVPDPDDVTDPIGRVLTTGQGVVCTKPDPAIAAERNHAIWEGVHPYGWVILPLRAHDQTMGAITFALCDPMRRWRDADVATCMQLAERVGVALQYMQSWQAREAALAVVSHDLRNPLNVINLVISLLQQYGDLPREKQQQQLAKLVRATQRMERLLADLLDAVRMQSGRFTVCPAPMDVHTLISDVFDAMRPAAEKRGLHFQRHVDDSLGHVLGDHGRIVQVLSSLLDNAFKFTPAGGAVIVRAEQHHAGSVRFSVEDTGLGIRKRDLDRVFDRFWQHGQRRRQGAGLGLTLAKGIIAAHGSHIGAESTLNKGSTFYFELPVCSAIDCAAAMPLQQQMV